MADGQGCRTEPVQLGVEQYARAMQGWIVAAAWAGVSVFAVIVLGFLSYEVSWKARRLSAGRAKLARAVHQLSAVAPVAAPGSHRQEER